MTVSLNESFGLSVLGKIEGKRIWRVKVIAPGKGSSGYYPEEVLRNDGPRAWPIGSLSHIDHQSNDERWNHPAKSLKTVGGAVASEPVYEDDGPEGPGLYCNIEFTKEWAPFIEQLHEHIGISISGKGMLSETETVDDIPVVEMLLPHPTNSIDVVTAAGAGGKFSEVIEQFFEHDRKDPGMKPEDIEKIGKALADALVPSLVEALKPEPVAEAEETEGVSSAEVAEALIGADLPEVARKRVYSAVEAGSELDEAIKEQKEFIEAIKAQSEANDFSEGVLHAGGSDIEEDYGVGVWN